jgi:Transposase IS4
MIVIDHAVEKIGKKEYDCIVVQSDEVMNGDVHVRLYAAKRHFKVDVEGNKDYFFDAPVEEQIVENPEANTILLPSEVAALINQPIDEDDIYLLRSLLETDSDNDPAPENLPDNNNNTDCVYSESWGHDGVCQRRKIGSHNKRPTVLFPASMTPSVFDIFELLIPKVFITDTMLPQMNERVELGKVNYGEFMRWLGLWFLMATIQGPTRAEFWKKEGISLFSGAPFRLGEMMTRNRFDDILKSIGFTNQNPPNYVDKFFPIRDLVTAWNDNMTINFTPGWISCLDESMMVWSSQFTCPGFMFVPRKPHPFGNEWHSICCGISGVMFAIELVEGKDRPPNLGLYEFEEKGKTVGLLLRLTKQLWGTGKVVVLDSGFCVLQGLIELRKKGVFAAAIVKKRRYWPKHIDGDGIKTHFEGKAVGETDAIAGTLGGVPFHIMGLKEAPYVMTMMTTYGTLERTGKETERRIGNGAQRERVKFNYPEVFGNHFKYRHMVDDHNARRHAPISFEESWATKTWTHRVFAFIIAISEVNCQLVARHFYNKEDVSQVSFRKELAYELIYNKYIVKETEEGAQRSRKRSSTVDHELLTLFQFKKFKSNKIVASNMKYAQFKCGFCIKRTRKYCKCTPGIYRCQECYALHRASTEIEVSGGGQT